MLREAAETASRQFTVAASRSIGAGSNSARNNTCADAFRSKPVLQPPCGGGYSIGE